MTVSGTVAPELAWEYAGIVSDTDEAPSCNDGADRFLGEGGVTIGG